MRIPIILGTAREGRYSEHVARYLLNRVSEAGHETELIDVRDFRLPATDDSGDSRTARTYAEKITGADALFVVMPEYNHGYPGELKMMLDLAYEEYRGKPVGICSVSSGTLGGARGAENLLPVLIAVGLRPLQYALHVPHVRDGWDEGRNPEDMRGFDDKVGKMLDRMSEMT